MSQQTNNQLPESQSASSTNSRAGTFDPPKNAALSQALGLIGPNNIPLKEVRSSKGKSHILTVGYRPSTKEAVIEFATDFYLYKDVPADIGAVLVGTASDEETSTGSFFNTHIKGKAFAFDKISKTAEAVAPEPEPESESDADFFRKLPAGEYEARKNAEINEVIQRAGVQVVAADTLGAMEALESDPTEENFQKFGEALDKSIEFLDALDALPEIPNLPVDDEEDRQAKKNPVTGWTHYPSGVSPSFDTEQDAVCVEPIDELREKAETGSLEDISRWSDAVSVQAIIPEVVASIPVELPTDKISTILKRANIDAAAIAAIKENFSLELGPNWKAAALAIVVDDESQTGLMKAAGEMRKALKKERGRIEKTRETLKESSLRTGQAIDAVAKLLKGEIEPVEKHLEAQEHYADIKRLEREHALHVKRSAELSHFDVQVESLPLGTMDEDTYQLTLQVAKQKFEERQAEAEQREADRIAEENRQREENEKLREENTRIATENKRIAAEKAESDRKAREVQQELDRKNREEDEKVRYAAALVAKKQVAPDVEKLRDLADQLEAIEWWVPTDGSCYAMHEGARGKVEEAVVLIRRGLEALCKK